MSRPWNPKRSNVVEVARFRASTDRWDRRRRGGRRTSWRASPAEWRLTLLGGLFLGLSVVAATSLWQGNPQAVVGLNPVEPPAADPWVESRRSAEILKAQEGAPPRAPARSPAAAAASPAHVRVIDGDTFDYRGERIRIVGLDAPETHPPRCAREAELGARATERLRAWLASGPFELGRIDRDEDRYGRELRIVSRGGSDVANVLIAEGLARPYGGGWRNGWCS